MWQPFPASLPSLPLQNPEKGRHSVPAKYDMCPCHKMGFMASGHPSYSGNPKNGYRIPIITLWLCQNSYWTWPFIVSFPVFPSKMVIFHSYVKLPEGMDWWPIPMRKPPMFEPTGWKPSERFRHFFNMFLGVGWGGLGWGNNVHVLAHSHDVTPRHVHLHVRTYVMLRWRCVTSRRGGWGNNVHVLAHSHDVTPRHVHLHVRTYVMLRWRCVTSRRGGVGWGGVGQ